MNKQKYNDLLERAKHVCRRHGNLIDPEDLVQENALAYTMGWGQTLDQTHVDLLRKEYGRTGVCSSSKSRVKSDAILKGTTSLDAPTSDDSEQSYHEIIASPGGDPEPLGANWRDRVAFRGKEDIVAFLYYDCDLNEKEIGTQLGFTESRACQIKKKADKRIASAAIMDEVWGYYNDDKEYSKLEIQWIAI